MIEKQEFFQTVENDLKLLRELTKEDDKLYMKKINQQREERERQQQVELKQKLKEKINHFTFLNGNYGKIVNGIIENNMIEHEYKFAKKDIEISERYSLFMENHYEKLTVEDRTELYLLLEGKIKEAITHPFCDYIQHISMFHHDEKDLLDYYPKIKSDEEYQAFMSHFKTIICAYLKGYILKNETRYYLTEALPSILWLIEKSNPSNLFSLYLFEYPKNLTVEETENEFYIILKSWYKEKGSAITSFENYICEIIEKDEYKNSRRALFRYQYLLENDFFKEKEQILLQMLHKQYLDYLKIENNVERRSRINDIRNELLHYDVITSKK